MKNQGKGFKEKKEAKRVMTTIGHQCKLLRKLKVSSLEIYLDKHGISWSTLKKNKVGIVAAHIARSMVNSDAMNNEEHDVEDEESDEESRDDVVMEEIGGDSDEDETTDTAQQSEKDEDDSEGDNDREDYNSSYDHHDEDDGGNDDDSGGGVSDDVNEGDNSDNSEEVQISHILCTTKSGKTCWTWKGRHLYY